MKYRIKKLVGLGVHMSVGLGVHMSPKSNNIWFTGEVCGVVPFLRACKQLWDVLTIKGIISLCMHVYIFIRKAKNI